MKPDIQYIPPTRPNGINGHNLPDGIEERLQSAVQKRKSGRASTFTEELALIVLDAIMSGGTMQEAAQKAGIDRTTLYVWREIVPGFDHMIADARRYSAQSMVDDGLHKLDSVDVSDPEQAKLAMAQLRKAEQQARFRFDLAKCYDFQTFGDKKHQVNTNVNVDLSPVDLSRWLNR
jgi:hypothetical protein